MYTSEEISFRSEEQILVGTLYKPITTYPYRVVVILHAANLGERNDRYYDHLKDLFTSNGIGVFLYDRRGTGDSTGNFNTARFEDLAMDALSAIAILDERDDVGSIGLCGISQGGWIASLATSLTSQVSFLIMVSTPGVSPSEQMLYASSISMKEAGFPKEIVEEARSVKKMVDEYFREKVEREGVQAVLQQKVKEAWYPYAYLPPKGCLPRNKKNSKWYYELDYNPIKCFKTVNIPLLFIFADKDIYVPVDDSIGPLTQATFSNKDVLFLTIKNTDHFMYDTELKGEIISKEYVTNLINWVDRFRESE
ncbi:alpha/beta hydrolase [Halalkalibacter okhensis]|uniref:Serine aminopeptidase S33 domain-containing protein n=1 Tax=Halalkalibacter okhensis TaxID=333138 RepID=A0A0B0IFX1_9BACI|nr:alpha/beta fold hydrolase [Halalkalibacter okhensis]KHF38571.1 hypothetical protein LQ50_20245 [Halalkalibacter okhensis]